MTDKTALPAFWGTTERQRTGSKGFYSSSSPLVQRGAETPEVLTSKQHVTQLRSNLGFFDKLAVDWPAAGFTDTEFRCDDGTGGGSWNGDDSAASSSSRR